MFESIKEFLKYIFTIERPEQLESAKYGEFDCLSFYLEINDKVRPLVLDEIKWKVRRWPRNQWDKFLEEAKNDPDCEDPESTALAKIHYLKGRYSETQFPLVRAIIKYEEDRGKREDFCIDEASKFLKPYKISDSNVRDIFIRWIATHFDFDEEITKKLLFRFDNGYFNYKEFEENEIPEITEDDEIFIDILNDEGFNEAMHIGLIKFDNGYKWCGTNGELALFADLMSEKLGITKKWKIFENLFKVKKLATANWENKEVKGRAGKRQDIILKLFGK